MEAADIKCLKELEEENRKLKRMVASLGLEYKVLKGHLRKKALMAPRSERKSIELTVSSG
jgi:putative transposase